MRFACAVAVLGWACAAAAQSEDLDTDASRALFRRGTQQYAEGHYREALASFEQAKAIRPLPAFDFNIGRIYERLGDFRSAVDAYERYLSSHPDDAADVRAHVRDLRRHAPPPSLLPTPSPPPSPSPSLAQHPGRSRTIAGGVVGGAGVVLLMLGIVPGVDGDRQADTLTAADRNHQPFDPAVERKLGTDRAAETALLVIGAAAGATGVVLVVLGQRADRRARAEAWSRR